MADATFDANTDTTPPRNDWREAGRGWGARAKEWAYLFEPYARPANDLLLDQLGVGDGTRQLDIACGSGLAANIAATPRGIGERDRRRGSADRHRAGADTRGRLPGRRHVRAPLRRRLLRRRDQLQRDLERVRGRAA